MINSSLKGVRVLDFSRLFPGPLCTLMLADLGADIIKVEPPEGEPARYYPPCHFGSGATFLQLNRGKRSLTLDLKKPPAIEVVHKLLKDCDILVESYRPGVMKRFGLDYDSLKEQFPSLIYCSITGYGTYGAHAAKPGHDLNYISLAGIVSLSGCSEKGLVIPPIQIADLLGGFQAGMAILAALIQRGREQHGQHLCISLLDGAFFTLISLAGMHFAGLPLRPETNPLSGRLACYNLYRTKDDRYLALALLEPKFWKAFCDKVGLSQYSENHLLQDQEKLTEVLTNKIVTRTLDEWMQFLEQENLCVTPVLDFAEALNDLSARSMLNVSYPEGKLQHFKTPFASESPVESPAPGVGQHTVEILTEIGYSFPEIESLKNAGVVQ
jgi:crotonobetainyl-CoA:carnitine CoA-transferase CaiB-like acyl-CoA transferase